MSGIDYDCLLEYAARQYGFKAIDYVSRDATCEHNITVWKIHGSCNFLPASVSGPAAGVSYPASGLAWMGEVRAVDASTVPRFVRNQAFYPAMAIFMQGKPVKSHPELINQLQTWWAEAVLKADMVGIVGVRPNMEDNHIWDALGQTPADLVVIGDCEAYQQWARSSRSGKTTRVVGDRFSPALGDFAELFSRT